VMKMLKPERFSDVDEALCRSALPLTPEEIDFLHSHGVKSIVSMESMPREAFERAKHLGIKVFSFPHVTSDSLPTEKEAKHFFQIIQLTKKSKGKVLVHCNMGRQRTGLMVAVYLTAKGENPLRAYQLAGTAEVEVKAPLAKNSKTLRSMFKEISAAIKMKKTLKPPAKKNATPKRRRLK